MHSAKPDSFEFGGFRLDRRRRLLYDTTGRPAHLTAKAFDLLVYFLEHPGEVIERETLIEALWPKTIVEDNNLNQVIAALRRVLGDGFIVTVTGRGYQFVVDPQPFTSATVTAPASSAEATERGAAPDAAEPKTPSAVPVEAPARSRWRALTAAAGVLALAIAAIAYLNRGPADAVATDPSAIGAFGSPAPSSARAVPTHAIAVLPFISLSDDSQQDYFADGLTEELINRLARFGRLQVTARTSSFTFKGSDKSVGEIARALEVRYVLEGSVARAEQQLRIRVQLVDASNGYSLWSESFDREVRDVLNIQEEIAAAVAESLLGPLGVQPHAAAVGGTTSTEAYELYLAAKASMNLSARDGTRGLEQIERALRLDPNFALAWAQKSRLLNSAAQYSWVTPQQQADAESAARRALELAPDLGLAHTALAATIMHDRVGAEAEFRKGLSLGSWEEVDLYGGFLNSVGHYGRAREYLFEARARDPLNPRAAAWLAGAYDGLGDSAAALAELERGRRVASQPRGALASEEMIIRLGLGEPDEARAVIERYPEFRESPDTRELLRQLEPLNAALGDPERVMTELRALRDQQVWGAMLFAIAAMSGEPEFAVEGFIEVERERKQPVLGYGILWRPVFRDARRLPRFKDLVREAGFIEYWREYGWPSFCRPVGADDFECV